ncbi:MAG: hypothetical protein AAF492_30785, partial [Verrucomicrobiota bacterium]
PIILNVTEFSPFYDQYLSGTIRPDKACRKPSESVEMSIKVKQPVGTAENRIPALKIRFQNLGLEPFMFRDFSIMIHIFSKETGEGLPRPRVEEGLMSPLKRVDCTGTDFIAFQKTWPKHPRLRHDETHELTVPLVTYSHFDFSGRNPKAPILTAPKYTLPPGTYQVIVSYFNNDKNIRKLSNPAEFTIENEGHD